MELSEQDWEVINKLRREGCAVVVFLPEELGEATPEDVEEYMCRRGWDVIFDLNGHDSVG